AFFDRCQEILNAGPGSGDRRSEAALGNNLGQLAAQVGNAGERRIDGGEEAVHRDSSGRLGWFAFFGFGENERAATALEAGFDGDLGRVGVGVDWRLSDHAVVGAVVSRFDADRRFLDGAGRADSRIQGVTGFLDWRGDGRMGANLYAGYGDVELDLQRRVRYSLVLNAGEPDEAAVSVDALATARPGGSQITAGGALHWDFSEGAFGRGLRLGSDFSRMRVDAFSET